MSDQSADTPVAPVMPVIPVCHSAHCDVKTGGCGRTVYVQNPGPTQCPWCGKKLEAVRYCPK